MSLLFTVPVVAQTSPAADTTDTAAIVQVAFTYADVSTKDLSRLGNISLAVGNAHDALSAAQSLAARRYIHLVLIPAQTVVTVDGQTGQLESTKHIPYGGGDMFGYNFAVTSGVSVTPHVSADGTATIRIVLKMSGRERPRLGDGKQSVTTELNVDTIHRFHSGDTQLIAGPLPDITPPRFVFATVTILPH